MPEPAKAMPTGVLLLNLGTPDSPSVRDVRRYLAEFLADPLVIDLPTPLRRALLHGIILRTRPARAAAAYRAIWTERGSPLRFHGDDLAAGLREQLGTEVAAVELAMRYGQPSIGAALERLRARGIDDVVAVPLFPQYSMAAWKSAAQAVFSAAARLRNLPRLSFVPPFYDHPAFLDAVAAVAQPVLVAMRPDKVLFSFHGLPEAHCRRSDDSPHAAHCLRSADCCEPIVHANRFCYRAQCVRTARGLADRLGLGEGEHETSFQSRLSRRWIRPFSDARIRAMPAEGARRIAVLCPSFVADCLETLEEIGLRATEDFRRAGGDELRLVPCVNADASWVSGLARIVRAHLPRRSG